MDTKKEAEIESMRSEWQPMGTTCKAWPFPLSPRPRKAHGVGLCQVKSKNLAQYAMLYSGKMYHVHKATDRPQVQPWH